MKHYNVTVDGNNVHEHYNKTAIRNYNVIICMNKIFMNNVICLHFQTPIQLYKLVIISIIYIGTPLSNSHKTYVGSTS